ncbi:unnamed protein product [Coffea canephora]|uniref:DUF1639 domain-containing protein n=1 Tax=Coffea canephora TaxID=49390 RepID=A0A068U6I2_COFCA|nr:unnamed protein product [Coffea canephora]
MIMRYQRVIPDSLPLSNGRRTNSTSTPSWKTSKEVEDRAESNGHITTKTSSNFEGKGLTRFRSPSKASQDHHIGNGNGSAIGGDEAEVPNSPPTASNSRNHQNLDSNGVVGGGGNDNNTFLQWGHRKRSRCSRGMALTDDTSSSTSTIQSTKLQRRLVPPHSSSSPNSNANAMPPPSLPSSNGISRGSNHKTSSKSTSPSPVRRNLEERSGLVGSKSPPTGSGGGGGSRAVASRSRGGKRSPSLDKKTPCLSSASARDEKTNACSVAAAQQEEQNQEAAAAAAAVGDVNRIVSPPRQAGGCSINDDNNHDNTNAVRTAKITAAAGGGERLNNGGGSEVNEWPRIYIPLSRKEKEEDFLAMKGTKLPHRPKKRPKTIDRILQYCFPGMWLSDLTRGRYEVREKKCPRKKRRGLKGMESLESDSE